MPLILAIETATKVCSVALFRGTELLVYKEEGTVYSHAEKLTLFIQDICTEAAIPISDIDAVAISKGPGSYTGLRIGVSTAKGICFALDKPLISIETLATMASGAKSMLQEKTDIDLSAQPILLCPMIDARRMEVYSAIFDLHLSAVKATSADVITPEDHYQSFLKTHLLVYFGDGAKKCIPILSEEKNTRFLDTEGVLPSARFMGPKALEKFENQQFEDVAYFEPYYLKDFMATQPKKQWSAR